MSTKSPTAPEKTAAAPIGTNPHGIPDWRLEQIPFHIESEWVNGEFGYKIVGETDTPVPPLRPSKYLSKEQSIEIYRLMLVNRRMEESLERMYKQSKVIGGLYLSLGQEACFGRLGLCAGQGRLARPDDPQPGFHDREGLPAARHHDAVHGQGRLAHARTRVRLALRRPQGAQRDRAHLAPRRLHLRAGRLLHGRAAAGQEHRRARLHRRWWAVDRGRPTKDSTSPP